MLEAASVSKLTCASPLCSPVMHAYAWGGLGDKYEEKVSRFWPARQSAKRPL